MPFTCSCSLAPSLPSSQPAPPYPCSHLDRSQLFYVILRAILRSTVVQQHYHSTHREVCMCRNKSSRRVNALPQSHRDARNKNTPSAQARDGMRPNCLTSFPAVNGWDVPLQVLVPNEQLVADLHGAPEWPGSRASQAPVSGHSSVAFTREKAILSPARLALNSSAGGWVISGVCSRMLLTLSPHTQRSAIGAVASRLMDHVRFLPCLPWVQAPFSHATSVRYVE